MSRNRWDIGTVAALILVAFGLLLASPVLVTGAVIALTYVLYGSVSSLPAQTALSATRTVEMAGARPGAHVDVTLRVENTGRSVLPDVRVVDGVPDELTVVDGSPRGSEALAPGKSFTVEYTLVLKRGRFEFDAPAARVRSLAGSDQRTVDIPIRGDSSLRSATPVPDLGLSEATRRHTGTVPTDSGGSGLEFYSTRQYHHGDPMNRINWHQVAKTGEFVTVQYRQERAVQTVIVVDCRPCTRVTPWEGYPTGGALSAYAAEHLYDALQAEGVVTTLTAVGLGDELPHLTGPDGLPWVDAQSEDGAATALFRGANRVATEAAGTISVRPPSPGYEQFQTTAMTPRADGGGTDEITDRTERLISRLPSETQVVLCSPMVDNWPVEFVRELGVRGYSCLLFSPDATAGPGYGQRLGGIHRRLRLRRVDRSGATVTDWRVDEPIEAVLKHAIPQL